jgi:lipoprotein-anchoring transpeptidase ErfK/SrfK
MISKSLPPHQALEQATAALQRGDKQAARHWAQIAAAGLPELEDPWLILAAVAKPRAGVAYLERALEINPHSPRARRGLALALRQADEQLRSVPRSRAVPASRSKPSTGSKSLAKEGTPSLSIPLRAESARRISIPILILTLAACLVLAWAIWPRMDSSARAAIHDTPAGLQADLVRPSDTPRPSATSTPSVTASPTVLPTTTSTATLTVTPLPTETFPDGEFVAAQLPAGGEKSIVVSIHEQHLYAYQDGTLVFSFMASTGRNDNTLTGSFSILDKDPNSYSAIWDFWMPDWMGIYFGGGLENGIHALPVLPGGETLWADSLGTPASYGCVVLGTREARLLYDWAEVGTTVQIDP